MTTRRAGFRPRRLGARLLFGLLAPSSALGCLQMLGLETPPDRVLGDAGVDPDGGDVSEASAPDSGGPEAETPPPVPQGPASCEAVRATRDLTGVYRLVQDGREVQAYCEMTIDGGGWTGFFAKTLGSTRLPTFDRAPDDRVTDKCVVPAAHCIRHLPENLDTSVEILATCGTARLKFTPTPEILGYFQRGEQSGWQALTHGVTWLDDATSSSDEGGADRGPFELFTGERTNAGWILASRSLVFASAYSSFGTWHYCNGRPRTDFGDAPPIVRLFYR